MAYDVKNTIVAVENTKELVDCLNGTNKVLANAIDHGNYAIDVVNRNFKIAYKRDIALSLGLVGVSLGLGFAVIKLAEEVEELRANQNVKVEVDENYTE